MSYLGRQINDNTKLLRSQAHCNAFSLAQKPLEMMVENEILSRTDGASSRHALIGVIQGTAVSDCRPINIGWKPMLLWQRALTGLGELPATLRETK